MLVLSRKKNEGIVFGNLDITVCVVDIRGDKVRIGVEAPRSVPVHRREVFDAIMREAAAGQCGPVPSMFAVMQAEIETLKDVNAELRQRLAEVAA